jgi:hypothetical protein
LETDFERYIICKTVDITEENRCVKSAEAALTTLPHPSRNT